MYSKTHWQDRVVDPETGEVVQEGTFMSAEHFNNMEDGIEANDTAISEISESVETIETTLDTGVGTTITLTVNSSTFVMKLALKNSEGDILSESEVDLPIESMIVNAEYVEATKSLVLTLQSGSKVTVPLSALINGLVNDTRKVAGMDLKKDITVAEMVTALGVDKKANKTEVSSSNETTSVINVTDAKAQMAMVAKISGKTQKVIQLISSAVSSVTNVSITAKNVRYAGGITFVLNHKYLMTGTCSVGGIRFQSDGVVGLCVITTQANQKIYKTFTCSRANFDSQPYLYNDRSETITISGEFQLFDLTEMFGAGKEPTEEQCKTLDVFKGYIAPTTGTLWSAPVESVVSQGENICNVESPTTSSNTVLTAVNDNTFTLTSTGVWTTWNVECDVIPNKQYRINYNLIASTGSAGKLYVRSKDGSTNLLDIDFNTVGASTKTFTPTENKIQVRIYPNNSATSANYSKTFKLAVVPSTESGTVYPPYNKTTVLVPSSVKNLPDYGCSVGDIANEIDFENGVYYHRVAKSVPLNWQLTSGYFFTSTLTNKKNGDSNFIHPLLSIGGLNVGAAEIPSGCARGNSSSYNIYARDTSITTAAAFNEKYGVPVIYELATTEVIPLADYLRPLPVEQGGTLTLVNEHNLDINSTIKYKKEVN